MKKILLVAMIVLLVPMPAGAQGCPGGGECVQSFLGDTIEFVNNTLIPLLIGIAFLFFLINAFRFFILGSGSEDARTKARSLALWGIAAFVLMVSIWGIVNLFIDDLGIYGRLPPCPDFLPDDECVQYQGEDPDAE